MGKAVLGAQEARGECNELPARGLGVGLAIQSALEDAPDALGIEELEGQRPVTGGVDALVAVLVGEPQQGLALAQLGPREVAGQEFFEEGSDVGTLAVAFAHERLGVAAGVGSELPGIVVVVSGTAAGGDARVGLDARALDEDAHELGIAAHGDELAHVAGRHGVEGFLELDVVIALDFGLRPVGGIEARRDEG